MTVGPVRNCEIPVGGSNVRSNASDFQAAKMIFMENYCNEYMVHVTLDRTLDRTNLYGNASSQLQWSVDAACTLRDAKINSM